MHTGVQLVVLEENCEEGTEAPEPTSTVYLSVHFLSPLQVVRMCEHT